MEVKGRAHPEHRHVQASPMFRHPNLLLRATDAHEQDPRARLRQLLGISDILRCGQRPKRRCDRTGNFNRREARL